MGVQIVEVKNKKDLKKWVEFPNKLYKKVDAYVPFLFSDEMATFDKEKNPAYEFCETRLFLAYRGIDIVGRIAGLINHAANKKWGTNTIRFTRFDFIDDFEVSKALFEKVLEWGKERGYSEIMGPIGFTDMDHEGMLVEGFDELNMSITFYNHPYYLEHLEKLGAKKDIDWIEYQVRIPEKLDDKFERMSAFLQKRNGFKLVTYKDRKALKQDAMEAFKLIDKAFSVLYGTVPLTNAVIEKALADYIPIVNLDYICSVRDKNDEIIGFAVLVPSIAKALKKSNGKFFPFGIFRMLRALKGKNDTLEMFFIAVKPELQKLGIPAIIMNHMIKVCMKNGVKVCETGPELEVNESVQSLWKSFDARQHRRRRCYKRQI